MRIGRTAVYNHLIEQCHSDGGLIEGQFSKTLYEMIECCEFEIEDAEDEELVEPDDYMTSKKFGIHIYKYVG